VDHRLDTLNQDPGSPTLTHLKALVAHQQWLSAQQPIGDVLGSLPRAECDQFAAEARSLYAARIQELEPKRGRGETPVSRRPLRSDIAESQRLGAVKVRLFLRFLRQNACPFGHWSVTVQADAS
jgi:hypothetical protein